jgi:hypothetical protein
LGKGNYNLSVRNSKEELIFLWRNIPAQAYASSLLTFLDYTQLQTHTHTHTHTVGLLWTSAQSLTQTTAYTTHNKHKRKRFLPSAGFEPAIMAISRLYNYALYSKATEIGTIN